jgi:hypothetical protein
MPTLKPRTKLNQAQTEILEALYKFRFATIDLISAYQELTSKKYTYTRLKILEDQKYIARHYDGQYKIHGKPALYYITKKGIAYLKTNPDLSVKALNGMYRDSSRNEQFMQRCLDIFKLFIKFNELYGDKLSFYSKAELTELEYFPRPLPDAYITLGTKQYMLELIDMTMSYAVTKRMLDRYQEHLEFGGWDELGAEYPTLLVMCENAMLERRVQKLGAKLVDDAEFEIYTTAVKAFVASGDGSVVWSNITEPDELISLSA